MSHFEIEDAPDYLEHFPVLVGKERLGNGEFSIVFEGSRPDTVLKLTVDQTTVEFIMMGCPDKQAGLVELVQYYGKMPNRDHGFVYLVEIKRLQQITPLHEQMWFEREVIMAAVKMRVKAAERFVGLLTAQERYAGALSEIALSNLFSKPISIALDWISSFMKTSSEDLLHDLYNPDNYMTDGYRLIITDPLVTVPA